MDEVGRVSAEPTSTTTTVDPPGVLAEWSARRVPPIVLLGVALVFLVFMALSHFVFHSWTGVKALAVAAVGFLIPLAASVASRIEYRMTGIGLERRPLHAKKPGGFQEIFRWDELSRIVPTKRGFQFHRSWEESNPLRRFWKAHLSDAYSGEVHVEAADRQRVLALLAEHGVPGAGPDGAS